MGLIEKIERFLETNPSDQEGELFYINEVLPYDKRSIEEILEDKKRMIKIEVPLYQYDDGKYQDKPIYDYEAIASAIEDKIYNKTGKDVIVEIKENK